MSPRRENVLGSVDPRRELGRPPLVGMDFLHQRPMRTSDLLRGRPRLQAKDLIRLLFRHYARPPAADVSLSAPRVRVTLEVRTPSGRPAATLSFTDS